MGRRVFQSAESRDSMCKGPEEKNYTADLRIRENPMC